MKKFFTISFIFIFIYILCCLCVYVFQDKMLYHPYSERADILLVQKEIKNLKEVSYSLPDGKKVYAWYLKPKNGNKIVLYFHGNTGNLNYNSKRISFFEKEGFGVFLPEYQGFGNINGNISQSGLECDVRTALNWLLSHGYKEENIIIYGHSLGTYMATYAASFMHQTKKDVGLLVLESPFYSILEMAKDRFGWFLPVNLLLNDKFLTSDIINDIKTRIVIGHGKKDIVIPYRHGLRLFEHVRMEKFFFSSDNADHNTLPEEGFISFALSKAKK